MLGWNIYSISSWWVQIFMFTPIWGRFPFWLIFFKWVEKPPTRYFWILLILWGGAWNIWMTWKCSQFESVRVRTWVSTIWSLVSWMPKGWSCRPERTLHPKYQYKYYIWFILLLLVSTCGVDIWISMSNPRNALCIAVLGKVHYPICSLLIFYLQWPH